MTPATGTPTARESAAQRQARLRVRSAHQREAFEAHWRRIEPTLHAVDAAVARLRGLRSHPIALGLAAVSAGGLLARGRGRRMLRRVRRAWRLAAGASIALSAWRALRATRGPAS